MRRRRVHASRHEQRVQRVRGGCLAARPARGQPRHLSGGVCGRKACAGRKRRPSARHASAHHALGHQAGSRPARLPGHRPPCVHVRCVPGPQARSSSASRSRRCSTPSMACVRPCTSLPRWACSTSCSSSSSCPSRCLRSSARCAPPARPRTDARAMPIRRALRPCQPAVCTRSAGQEAGPALRQPARRAQPAPRPPGHHARLGRRLLPRVAGQRVHQLPVWQLRQPPLRLGAAGVSAAAGARRERPSNPHPALAPSLGEPSPEPGASRGGGRAIRRSAPLPPLHGTHGTHPSLPRRVRRCSSA